MDLLLLKKLIVALSALIVTLQGLVAHPPIARFSPKHQSGTFGAITGSGSFPTSTLNNFNDGDIINSGDWNAIERKVGIDNSTDTTSLTYRAFTNASTSNVSSTRLDSTIGGNIVNVSSTNITSTNFGGTNANITNASHTSATITNLFDISGVRYSTSTSFVLINATTTGISTYSTTATTTLVKVTIPANTLTGNNAILTTIWFKTFKCCDGSGTTNLRFNLSYGSGATTTVGLSGGASAFVGSGKLEAQVMAANANNAQNSDIYIWANDGGSPGTALSQNVMATNEGHGEALANNTSAVDASVAQVLTISTTNSVSAASVGAAMDTYLVVKAINQ